MITEPSRKVVSQQTLESEPSVYILYALEVETKSTALSVWTPAISPGALKALRVKSA